MDKLISKLIEEIIRRIPAGTKPVDYLTDMLNTSRESAYRRLRNEVPFTFGEVALLTRQLDISLDEIMEIDKQGRIIMDLHIDAYSKPDKNFQILFEKYYKYIDGISKAQNQSTAISSNRISLILLMKYDALFKFFYFKYIHQMGNTHRSQEMFFNSRFSDIPISSEVEDIRQKFMESIAELDNVTAIYGNDLFLSTVRDIRYYHNRELISKAEVLALKEELFMVLEELKRLMQSGNNDAGKKKTCYLSLLDMETNCEYAAYDEKTHLLYWIYSVNFVSITDPTLCMAHRERFEAMKKTAILLSESNEIQRAEFLGKQQHYIENIINDIL